MNHYATYADNPFVVGAEVYVSSHHHTFDRVMKCKIAKVYKNGNFVLEGSDNTQYRPSRCQSWLDEGAQPSWTASATGKSNSWSRTIIQPVNAETTASFEEQRAKRQREVRANKLKSHIASMPEHHFTDAQLDALEKALNKDMV